MSIPAKITMTSDITVRPIQKMGGDHLVVAAAKVSTHGEAAAAFAEPESAEANAGLIRFLMAHRHGTPFEHSSLTFFVHAPIFVWREWHRHRVGFCLAGDTEIWTESYAKGSGRTLRKKRLKDLHDIWKNGVRDSLGRVRFLPSVRNQNLRVLNEDTGFFQHGGIEDVTESGVKECLFVETEHKKGFSLRCSADHRILTSEGWARAGDLVGDEMIAVSGKKSIYEHRQIPPSLRSGIGVWTSMQRETLIPHDTECYLCGKPFHRSNLVLDHFVPVVEDLKRALDPANLRPACHSCHKAKTDKEQILAQRCNVAGVRFERLRKKPYVVSEEMTYDISVKPPWHNFVANGIVVHNSYNEESARYKPLDPVFWVPRRDRRMIPVEGWKPGRPKFRTMDEATADRFQEIPNPACGYRAHADAWYAREIERDRAVYQLAYDSYRDSIDDGIAMEVARCKLPVAIYSSCWVTTNPRALMAFLSLRVHDPEAKYVSYPQAEIDEAAKACEAIFAEGWPITHKAFCDNGRVGP
jgi:thymidylate synthase ThyX